LEKDLLKWRGHPPQIELEYNESIHFLYKVVFLMNRDEAQLTAEDIHNIFVEDLALSKVISLEQSKSIIKRYSFKDQENQQAKEKLL